MTVTEVRYHKKDIARCQLETAVCLFLLKIDLSSAITLAGAAANILDRLVRNEGKEPFVDYARRVHHKMAGYIPKRRSYSHHIDVMLGVIAHKHMGKEDSETVDLDLERMAVDAIIRALADYMTLYGQEDFFVKSFLNWTWVNKNGKALMEEYEALPKEFKRS